MVLKILRRFKIISYETALQGIDKTPKIRKLYHLKIKIMQDNINSKKK